MQNSLCASESHATAFSAENVHLVFSIPLSMAAPPWCWTSWLQVGVGAASPEPLATPDHLPLPQNRGAH